MTASPNIRRTGFILLQHMARSFPPAPPQLQPVNNDDAKELSEMGHLLLARQSVTDPQIGTTIANLSAQPTASGAST
eukprot:4189553-Pyramimonas_sp.AAC.1